MELLFSVTVDYIVLMPDFNCLYDGAEEMAQLLKTLPEPTWWQTTIHISVSLVPGYPIPSSGLCAYCTQYGTLTYM